MMLYVYVFERLSSEKNHDYNLICYIGNKTNVNDLMSELNKIGYKCKFINNTLFKCKKCNDNVIETIHSYLQNLYYSKIVYINGNIFYLIRSLTYYNITNDINIALSIICVHKRKKCIII